MTVFGMHPPTSEVAYQWEMFGFAVLQSLGIKADEDVYKRQELGFRPCGFHGCGHYADRFG